jgi:fatty acid desaturase
MHLAFLFLNVTCCRRFKLEYLMSIIPAAQDDDQAARTKATKLEGRILLAVLIGLVCWGLSIFTWGVPGLYIPALALVPVMYVLLILISRG